MKGEIMRKWNDASVLGNSTLFLHRFTLHYFTEFLNDQTSKDGFPLAHEVFEGNIDGRLGQALVYQRLFLSRSCIE